MSDFTLVWITIIAIGIFLYVVLDGFDLGVGVLSRFAPSAHDKETMINSIAPFWDGNETWLILGAVGLLAAFPLAFAIIVPALYFPILMMLVGLMLRGVAFEYRHVKDARKSLWDGAFFWGSTLAAFSQGIMLGMFVDGFAVEGRNFAGGSFDWDHAFPLVSGLALVFGYGLLGAAWLVLKTEGSLQTWARRQGRTMLLAVLAFIGLVTFIMLFAHPLVVDRWLSWPNIALLWPVPLATAVAALWLWRAFDGIREADPFIATVVLFGVSFLGLAISFWPMIVPYKIDLWSAAASPKSQSFLLIGTLVLLPVVLIYTGWSYWVFRGKVRAHIGYGGGH
jgi:cytochrome d ubiquinol oxidase subunit II